MIVRQQGRVEWGCVFILDRLTTVLISQNVFLFRASEGLAAFVSALIDGPALAKAMELRPDQRITLAQWVEYTK